MKELKVILATQHPKMKNACDGAIEVYPKSDVDAVIAEYQEKILVLEKSYKKLVKRFVHETSVAESYRSLVYKEDALKYQKVGNSEMYEELSKKSDKAYRHANRWRRIFRKMSQEEK